MEGIESEKEKKQIQYVSELSKLLQFTLIPYVCLISGGVGKKKFGGQIEQTL